MGTPEGSTQRVELVLRAWQGLAEGDPGLLRAALASDARWRGVEDGPRNCESRRAILDVMGRNLENGLRGKIEETLEDGEHMLVAFRPELRRRGRRPLDEGIAYVVLTFRGGQVVEMKGCADRDGALAYLSGSGGSISASDD